MSAKENPIDNWLETVGIPMFTKVPKSEAPTVAALILAGAVATGLDKAVDPNSTDPLAQLIIAYNEFRKGQSK